MKTEFKTPWVEALRSGRFNQNKEVLKGDIYDGDGEPIGEVGYCCLGVLCEISGGEFVSDATHRVSYVVVNGIRNDDEELNSSLLDYFGINSEQQKVLIKLNDGDEDLTGRFVPAVDFNAIADYIEENL